MDDGALSKQLRQELICRHDLLKDAFAMSDIFEGLELTVWLTISKVCVKKRPLLEETLEHPFPRITPEA